MDFPISFNIEQLGLSECLFEDFKTAEILEQHGYRACIVGDAASVMYGSDLVIGDIFMAIADEQLQPAFQMQLWLARTPAQAPSTETCYQSHLAHPRYVLAPGSG